MHFPIVKTLVSASLALSLPAMLLVGCLDDQSSRNSDVSGPSEEHGNRDSAVGSTSGIEEKIFDNTNRRVIPANQASALAKASTLGWGEFVDGSGTVHTKVWECSGWGAVVTVLCNVDDQYVLVGGGSRVEYVGGHGAFLTSNRPFNDQWKTWEGKSKQHIEAYNHTLKVFAIGMRIDGIDKQTLQSHMVYRSVTSTTTAHPTSNATLPTDYILTGGGAFVNYGSGAGNLLVESYPYSSTTWQVKSKDHKISSPATITAYALGIRKIIPGYGTLAHDFNEASSYTSKGLAEQSVNTDAGYCLTGVGAKSTWDNTRGRLLMGLAPQPQAASSIKASSKDLKDDSPGTLTVYAVQIKRL